MTNEAKVIATKGKIDELNQISVSIKDQVSKLEEELQKVNPIELVIPKYITFHKFDPAIKYTRVNNWVLIGSLGDPESWEGSEPVVRKKSYG